MNSIEKSIAMSLLVDQHDNMILFNGYQGKTYNAEIILSNNTITINDGSPFYKTQLSLLNLEINSWRKPTEKEQERFFNILKKNGYSFLDNGEIIDLKVVSRSSPGSFLKYKREDQDLIFIFNGIRLDGVYARACLFCNNDDNSVKLFISKDSIGIYIGSMCNEQNFSKATEEEKQLLLDHLENEWYTWDKESLSLKTSSRWTPKDNETVFYVIPYEGDNPDLIYSFITKGDLYIDVPEKYKTKIYRTKQEADELCKKLNSRDE